MAYQILDLIDLEQFLIQNSYLEIFLIGFKYHWLTTPDERVGAVSDIEELDNIQIAILVNLCSKTKGSKGSHLPKPYFMNKPQTQDEKLTRPCVNSSLSDM